MRYEIRRVSLWSTLRFGLMAGVALAVLPALCIATLMVQAVHRIATILAAASNINVALPNIDVGIGSIPLPPFTLDLIQTLGLHGAVQTTNSLGANQALLFLGIALLVILASGLLLALPLVIFGLIYNLIAPTVGGFQIDLRLKE